MFHGYMSFELNACLSFGRCIAYVYFSAISGSKFLPILDHMPELSSPPPFGLFSGTGKGKSRLFPVPQTSFLVKIEEPSEADVGNWSQAERGL